MRSRCWVTQIRNHLGINYAGTLPYIEERGCYERRT
jgi:hypothetical protein